MSEGQVEVLADDDSLDGVERELLEGQAARLVSDEVADRAAARLVVQRFRAGERRRARLWVGGSALALAAAVALAFGLSQQAERGAAVGTVAAGSSSLVVEAGSVRLPGGALVRAGQPVAAETLAELGAGTCLRAGSNVRLCSRPGAKLKLPALGAAWSVELESGAITADLGPMPAGFAVQTLHGSAVVVGTLFSVEVDPSRAFTTVSVERGSVRVHNQRSGEEALLASGALARLGERLSVAAEHAAEAAASGKVGALAPGEAPEASAAAATHHGSSSPLSPTAKTAADLLEEARQARGGGHYGAAAAVYRKLVQLHPESPEARAALVSLGQLELGQLGQPEAALRSFRAYLSGSGQLRQEAEYGVIQALQRLGRKQEERQAIQAFLARYPKSTQAGPLSQRLKQL